MASKLWHPTAGRVDPALVVLVTDEGELSGVVH
ncbi:hypothetical protein F4554_000270 [Actinopolymorpha rutila]|uniref:Uncharacterized protein n=1 Tax=Actinopolymorpha rutila TaxID=446787 RepID=A0A852Z6W9_9ACTN|nr:hypothetical protein [Actinopolymorpha rutila]